MSINNINNISQLTLLNLMSNVPNGDNFNNNDSNGLGFELALNSLLKATARTESLNQDTSDLNCEFCHCNYENNQIMSSLETISSIKNIVQNINLETTNEKGISTIESNNNSSSQVDKAVKLAYDQLGKPYVWGANGPTSFDCSGLTKYIYKEAFNKTIPRVSSDQARYGKEVKKENLQTGDLVFFDTMNKGRVSHVGIYIGNGEFIHASNPKDGVKKSNLNSSFYQKTYRGARRP